MKINDLKKYKDKKNGLCKLIMNVQKEYCIIAQGVDRNCCQHLESQ